MPITTHSATHYRVICFACRKRAEVCPRRARDLDMHERAVQALMHAGWHQEPTSEEFKEKQRGLSRAMGRGRWYCTACKRCAPSRLPWPP